MKTIEGTRLLPVSDLVRLADEYNSSQVTPLIRNAPWAGDEWRLWGAAGAFFRQQALQLREQYTIKVISSGQPYETAEEQLADLDRGCFTVTEEYSDHPFWDVPTNVAFRICHDITGHYLARSDFSVAGEVAAFTAQASCTPEAFHGVLFCESISQLAACLVNGEFPPQKCFVTTHQGILDRLVAG